MSLGTPHCTSLKISGESWSQEAKVTSLLAREGKRSYRPTLQRWLVAQQLPGAVGSTAIMVTGRKRTQKRIAAEVQA